MLCLPSCLPAPEITPDGNRVTKLDQILLNGNNICMVSGTCGTRVRVLPRTSAPSCGHWCMRATARPSFSEDRQAGTLPNPRGLWGGRARLEKDMHIIFCGFVHMLWAHSISFARLGEAGHIDACLDPKGRRGGAQAWPLLDLLLLLLFACCLLVRWWW
jgi:hypothetical protein